MIICNFKNILSVPDEEPLKTKLTTMNDYMTDMTEKLHLKSLDASLKAVNENSLLTARSYCCLGRHYQNYGNYFVRLIFSFKIKI